MTSTQPLNRFPLFRTRSAEEMRAALAQLYGKPTLSFERGVTTIDAVANHHRLSDIGLAYVKYGTTMNVAYPEGNFTMQAFPVRGAGAMTIGKTEFPLNSRRGAILAGTGFAARLGPDYEHLILTMDTRALTSKLAAIVGAPIDRPLSFRPRCDYDRLAAEALRDHFLFLVDKVNALTAPLPKPVLAEFEQMLMVMVLHANRHNYSHLLEQTPADAAPREVRRAEEYIEANHRQAIKLEDLARETGVSAFSLFRSFKQSRGYSPMQFLARVRARPRGTV